MSTEAKLARLNEISQEIEHVCKFDKTELVPIELLKKINVLRNQITHAENVAHWVNINIQQSNCEHTYVYSGHSHNDDAYTCTKCGHIKYE